MKSPLPLAALLSGALLSLSTAAHGVTLAQVDDFEAGTVLGWGNGSAPDPVNITTGGPLGLNDNYLQITSDGSGPGGKLTSYNRAQWLGNYNAAGVTEIAMDLKGFSSPGSADLSIRFALKTGTGSGAPGYVSTTAFALPIDGLWHHAVFSLSAMTAVGSPGTLNAVLAGPLEARILHAAAANTVHGDSIVGQFGVDNIQAVPEPAVTGLCALGFGAFALRRRARR